jgi:hypothetical protein
LEVEFQFQLEEEVGSRNLLMPVEESPEAQRKSRFIDGQT